MGSKYDDPSMQQVVDFVTDRVAPGKHSNLAINPNHRTVLTGLKSKKQLSNKKVRKNEKPSKTLTRKQFAELGLYTLPTKSLKYTDMLPLHDMWTQYIRQQLKLYLIGNGEEQRIPEVHEATYDAFSKAVVKADLHGAIIKVAASKCPSLVGQTGIVVMETKNSFKIVSRDNRTRTIPKPESMFKIVIGTMEFTIYGKYLNIRPAERSTRKIKNFMDPEL